jgi:hypothetical protein
MDEMKDTPTGTSRNGKMLLRMSVFLLALSGLGQMPIFKRYYLADIPGLGWLADFALLHLLHYGAAAVFLLVIFHRGAFNAILLRKGLYRPGLLDLSITGVIGAIILTGVMRVLKNFPSFSLTPGEALFADLVHLAAVIVFGLLAMIRAMMQMKSHGERGRTQRPSLAE